MLPRTFSATGAYTDREKDRARGYCLLAHAEIESYIEDAARQVVLAAVRKWDSTQQAGTALTAFIASYHSGWYPDAALADEKILAMARSRRPPKDCATEVVQAAMAQYSAVLDQNHGIRANNLQRVLVPAGVDLSSLDATWLTTLDDFGSRRGAVAHRTASATQAIDPKSELERIEQLLTGLSDLDEILVGLA